LFFYASQSDNSIIMTANHSWQCWH